MPSGMLKRLDSLVRAGAFDSRSQAIADAIEEKLCRLDRTRLARECDKLNRRSEQAMAEEGLGEDVKEWPEY